MKTVGLTAYKRSETRRKGNRAVRARGRVPGVVYGGKKSAENVEVSSRELGNLIQHSVSEHLLVDLAMDGESGAKRLVLLQEIQHEPLGGEVLHVDFHEVAENEKVTLTVPVETSGEAVGVKTGNGTLEHVLFKVRVRSLPRDLPEFIEVDVSELQVGDSLHIGELKVPEGVEVLGDPNIPVVSVAAPRVEAADATAAEGAVPASPVEVIKEKKEAAAKEEKKK